VRHGETDCNKRNIIQGHSDAKLNKTGILQAKQLGKRLKDEKIDIVFCSDLSRAKQTAKEILKYHKNVPIKYNKLLRERAFGVFENTHVDEYGKHRETAGKPRHLYRPLGGENFYDMRKRVGRFLKSIYPKYRNKTVLVVTHGGVNRIFITIFMKKPLKAVYDVDQHNTCVNIVEISHKRKFKIHTINCTKHL
jgi:broad specificity phosphatase PhoE